MISHGLELEIDGRRGDPSEEDPRFRDDEICISGAKIADEAVFVHWLNQLFEVGMEPKTKALRLTRRYIIGALDDLSDEIGITHTEVKGEIL